MPLPSEILEQLPEDLQQNPTLSNYNTLEDALRGFVETKSMVGRSIQIPGEDAGEADKTAFLEKLINNAPDVMLKPDFSEATQSEEFYRTIGKPEEFSKYENPPDVTLPSEVESQLREMAFDANLTNAQYKVWAKKMADMTTQTTENLNTAFEEDQASLKAEWGMTVDERLNAAKQINDQFYPGRDFETLSAAEKKGLYNQSVAFTGQGPQAPLQPTTPAGMTPDEAMERAGEIMRKVHDPESGLSHKEKLALINKRIKILQTYVPKFQEA